jgi:hypothetical protein
MIMQKVYLSRRNLLTLLNKLDRNKEAYEVGVYGPVVSACTIVKQDTVHPKYPCSDVIYVTAVEDDEYYTTGLRAAGEVHPADDPGFKS